MKGTFKRLAMLFLGIFVVLAISPVFSAECTVPDNVHQAVDISTGGELKLVCDADSQGLAEVMLAKQKTSGCFISKEQGEEIYHVFCPISTVTSGK
jgi:hypothetical protein